MTIKEILEMDINELTSVLKTPIFWVVSAIGSVAVSILGNLLTPKISTLLETRSSSKRQAEDYRKAKFFGEVIIRVAKPERILHTKLDSMHAFLLACVFMLLALLLFTTATALEWLLIPKLVRIATAIFAIPFVWMSFYLTNEGLKWRNVALSAEKRIDAEEKLKTELGENIEDITSRMESWDRERFGITASEVESIIETRRTANAEIN